MLTTNIIPHLHQSIDTRKERGMEGGREGKAEAAGSRY